MKTLPLLLFLLLIGCSKEPSKEPLYIDSGTLTDTRDFHVYKWVQIGEQIWMAENLAYFPSVSPSLEGSDTDPFYYVYDYEGSSIEEAKANSNYSTYGVLYNWEAARTACPSGWHLPSDAEWKILERFLGMSTTDINREGSRESGSIGRALKSTSEWYLNSNGNNRSGFNVFPAGDRDNQGFVNFGEIAYFWSSTEGAIIGPFEGVWIRGLWYWDQGVFRNGGFRNSGFSVRCIKDN
jgi:uncharacterized protein (TIGR02145 family)